VEKAGVDFKNNRVYFYQFIQTRFGYTDQFVVQALQSVRCVCVCLSVCTNDL